VSLAKPESIDEYLANIPPGAGRDALTRIRAIVLEEAPQAKELISYGIPAFKLNRPFIWFAAYKNHCSLFAGHTVKEFADELRSFTVSKGTIQFRPDNPIPEALVRAILRVKIAEDAAKSAQRSRSG